MIANRRPKSRKRCEQGYALLMVIFMATMLLILATMAAPNIKIEGQREKEKEMIWRGQQYARGIKLYYRKLGHFPTSLDDLTKPKIGSLRFMRQAYKDPMNAQDGSWRLIYVGPAGQLIGSLKPQPQNLLFGQVQGVGTPVGALAGSVAPNSGFGSVLGQAIGQVGGVNSQGSAGTQPGSSPGFGSNPSSNPSNPLATTGPAVSADQSTGTSPDTPIPTDDPPTILGGNIIGVGGKINMKSVKVYDHANNYRLFEFIWNPSKDMFGLGQPGVPTGAGQPLGQLGGSPGVPPPQNPQNPQNPPQAQNPQQQ